MIKTYLTADEIRGMIDAADNLRDKLIISFYADTGARASELLQLRVRDIDLKNNIALIPHLKRGVKKACPGCGRTAGRNTRFCSKCGRDLSKVQATGIEERTRLINISPQTKSLLQEYVEPLSPDDLIIGLTRQQVYNIVRGLAARIGIDGKSILNPETGKLHFVHPHNFRDSLAVEWLNFAADDISKQKALQEHLGHKSFNTTMRYHKLAPDTVQKISNEVWQARFNKEKES